MSAEIDLVASALRREAEHVRTLAGFAMTPEQLAESLDRVASDIEDSIYYERMGDDL